MVVGDAVRRMVDKTRRALALAGSPGPRLSLLWGRQQAGGVERDTLYAIGELSRRTGLTVKTIRFYSDKGIVPPTDRSPAGYRLYGVDALARLDLVRTLRDLGLGLATVRKVLDREASMAEVAEVHADALDVQIQTLRLRRAILRSVARRDPTDPHTERYWRLVATVNGWPASPTLAPVHTWFAIAFRHGRCDDHKGLMR